MGECDHCGHEAYTRLGTRCLDCGVGFYVEATGMVLGPRQQQARNRAVQVLQHYVTMALDKAGVKHTFGDTQAEIAQIVDDIIEAATPTKTAHEQAVEASRGAQRI
jgi:hypothetical protein